MFDLQMGEAGACVGCSHPKDSSTLGENMKALIIHLPKEQEIPLPWHLEDLLETHFAPENVDVRCSQYHCHSQQRYKGVFILE